MRRCAVLLHMQILNDCGSLWKSVEEQKATWEYKISVVVLHNMTIDNYSSKAVSPRWVSLHILFIFKAYTIEEKNYLATWIRFRNYQNGTRLLAVWMWIKCNCIYLKTFFFTRFDAQVELGCCFNSPKLLLRWIQLTILWFSVRDFINPNFISKLMHTKITQFSLSFLLISYDKTTRRNSKVELNFSTYKKNFTWVKKKFAQCLFIFFFVCSIWALFKLRRSTLCNTLLVSMLVK